MDDPADDAFLAGFRLDPALLALPDATPAREPTKAKRNARAEPFVHVTDRELLAGAEALDSAQELLVWLHILRERRWRRSVGQPETFALSNGSLRAWAGINKMTKLRTLRKLAAAGLIRVEKEGRASLRVTVCGRG